MEKEIIFGASIKIHTDGGARGNPGPAACAFVVIVDSKVIFKDSKYLGIATNNIAEYEGVILALEWLKNKVINNSVEFYLDSQLVVNQINGLYKVKNANLLSKYNYVNMTKNGFKYLLSFHHIPRNMNKLPDQLLNKTIDENT